MVVSLYLLIGICFVLLVIMFPEEYQQVMKDNLSIIKKAQLKLEKKEGEHLNYESYLDNKIRESEIEHQENPNKGIISAIFLLIIWPFFLFILILAFLLDLFYLD